MIDIHTHILPGIDDGAANMAQSLQMLEESRNQGVTKCVVTPHIYLRRQKNIEKFLKNRDDAIAEIAVATKDMQLPRLIPGAEVYMDNDISHIEGIRKLCMGDTYFMLIEFPLFPYPGQECCEWLYNLNLKGIIPIIAHIDRYPYWRELISDLSGVKLVYQINNTRAFDISGRRFIKKLLDTGYMVVMSSDMHNTDTRPCDMKKAYDILKKKMPAYAEKLFEKNAEILLNINGGECV